MATESEVIVIGEALREYAPEDAHAPPGPGRGLEIWPLVEFRVLEVLKGEGVPDSLAVFGTLTDTSNFNTGPVPYTSTSQKQRSGWLRADRYERNGCFLLFLDVETDSKTGRSYFIVQYDPDAPNSEQVRSAQDPWVLWVKGFLEGGRYERWLSRE
jgi:hypothetical protein